MTTNTPAVHESAASTESIETIEDRSIRALTEKMTVLPMGGDVFEVVSESGSSYRVDARRDICDCPDFEYRDDIDRCKHVRRVAFATGEQSVPSWVERDAVDPQMGEHTDGGPLFADEQTAVTDGGSALEQSADDTGFTYHVEPEKQGGERYVRCEDCGRELLCRLGGREDLPHKDRCSNGEGN